MHIDVALMVTCEIQQAFYQRTDLTICKSRIVYGVLLEKVRSTRDECVLRAHDTNGTTSWKHIFTSWVLNSMIDSA